MKILAHEIDENGFFVSDVFVGFDENLENSNLVMISVPEGLQRPKWTGKDWVEGETRKIVEKTPSLPSIEERLKSVEDVVMALLSTNTNMLDDLESE